MLRTFAIVIAGAGIFASLPLTNARACDDDRYPCPIRSEALIQETVQAPDQLAPDEPQKKSAQPQKKAKQPASTKEKAHAKRDPRAPVGAKVSKPARAGSRRPTPCRRRRQKLLLLRSPLRVRMSKLSMTKAGAEVCLRLRERLGRFLQVPRALRTRRRRRASTLRTPHRMRCKWSTRTRSMSSIARRASSRLGSTISCGCWARRSLPDLHCGFFENGIPVRPTNR